MRKQIDIEELAMKLHELFDCEIVDISEHPTIFFPNSTLVYCHDADQPRMPSFILPVKVVASDPKYFERQQIIYTFDFSKSDENRRKRNE